MPDSSVIDSNYWRKLANGAHRLAENLTDATARGHMIASAESYEQLAVMAEKHPIYLRVAVNDR